MVEVVIEEQYRTLPGIGFMVLTVDVDPAYETDVIRAQMETEVTRLARVTCGDSGSWKDVEGAGAYVEFYRAMGLKATRVSNPFRQAFRFTKKAYRSLCPLIDLAMLAEYATGVSFQVISASAMGGPLVVKPVAAAGLPGNGVPGQAGEIGMYSGDCLLHSPSGGLLPQAMLQAGETRAVVRLMCPPGLGLDRMQQARALFASAPFGVAVRIRDEWSFGHD